MEILLKHMLNKINHYMVKDLLFIDYLDAFKYCLKHKININEIIKTKQY